MKDDRYRKQSAGVVSWENQKQHGLRIGNQDISQTHESLCLLL
jgi:hypothetical protein